MDPAIRLPEEVLEMALDLLPLRDLAQCMLVSRHWLLLSRSAAHYWREVQLDAYTPKALDGFKIRMNHPSNAPLKVKVTILEIDAVASVRDIVMPLVLNKIHRIDELYLNVPVDCSTDVYHHLKTVNAPRLGALVLLFVARPECSRAPSLPADLLAGGAPKLATLVLHNVTLCRNWPKVFRNIENATFTFDDGDRAYIPLPEAAAFPKLLRLSIAGAFEPPQDDLYEAEHDVHVKELLGHLRDLHLTRQYSVPARFMRWQPMRRLRHVCTGDRDPKVFAALLSHFEGDILEMELMSDEARTSVLPAFRSYFARQFKIAFSSGRPPPGVPSVENFEERHERHFIDFREVYDSDQAPHPALIDRSIHTRVTKFSATTSLWLLAVPHVPTLPNCAMINIWLERPEDVRLIIKHRIVCPKLKTIQLISGIGENMYLKAEDTNELFLLVMKEAKLTYLKVMSHQVRYVGDSIVEPED